MSNPTIEARLVGSDQDTGHVQLHDFIRFCEIMNVCLKRSEAILTAQPARIRYRIVGLRDASAGISLEAIRPKKGSDDRAEVVSFFKQTVQALQTGGKVDPRLTPEALYDFRELYKAPKKAKEIWIGDKQITSRYLANIDEILKPSYSSEGSVTGVLERLNVHNKNEFYLYHPIWGAVACAFPAEIFEQVRAGIKRNVTVSGTLMYPPDRPFPTKVQAKRLEIHPPDNELPTLKELRGLFRGCTGRKTATEFVRGIRDEQD